MLSTDGLRGFSLSRRTLSSRGTCNIEISHILQWKKTIHSPVLHCRKRSRISIARARAAGATCLVNKANVTVLRNLSPPPPIAQFRRKSYDDLRQHVNSTSDVIFRRMNRSVSGVTNVTRSIHNPDNNTICKAVRLLYARKLRSRDQAGLAHCHEE